METMAALRKRTPPRRGAGPLAAPRRGEARTIGVARMNDGVRDRGKGAPRLEAEGDLRNERRTVCRPDRPSRARFGDRRNPRPYSLPVTIRHSFITGS